MGQVMAYEQNKEPDPELATRTGELAMLIYSIGRCFKLCLYNILTSHPLRSRCRCRHHSSTPCEARPSSYGLQV